MQRLLRNFNNHHFFLYKALFYLLFVSIFYFTNLFAQELNETEEYVFDLKAENGKYILLNGLVAYKKNDLWYLPFEEIVNSMGFYIEGLNSSGIFEGYVRDKSIDYKVNFTECQVVVDGDTIGKDCDQIYKSDDIWYLEKGLIEKVFQIKINVISNQSTINITSILQLPSIAKENFKSISKKDDLDNKKPIPILSPPYDWYDGVNIYQRFNYSFHKDTASATNEKKTFHDTYINGELLKMAADVTFSAEDGVYKIPWASLKRIDPDGNIGGDAKLTSLEIGNVNPITSPLLRTNSRLTGLAFSNKPLTLSTSSSTQNFQGDLKRGWFVELYHNDILIESQHSNENQRYDFQQIPLFIGQNRFHLIFNGPHGEIEHNYITYNLSNDFATGQRIDYSTVIAVTDSGDSDNTIALSGRLTKRLLTTLYLKKDDDYRAQLDIKGFLKNTSYVLTQAYSSKGSVYGADTSLQSGDLFINASLYDFNKYLIINTPTGNEIDYQTSLTAFLPLFDFFQIQQSYKKTAFENSALFTELYINRVTFPIYNHALSHEATWDENLFSGEFFTRLNMFGFSNKVAAAYVNEFDWNQFSLESGFNEDYFSYSFKLLRHVRPDYLEFSLSMQKTIKALMVFLETSFDDNGNTSVSLGLGNLFSSDIKTGHYTFSPPRQKEFGQMLLIAFEDTNHNGIKDENEQLIKNFKIRESYHNRTFSTDERGEIFIDQLPPWRDIKIDYFTEDIGNIYLYTFQDTESFFIRPGKTFVYYVALRTLGEIYGTILDSTKKDKSHFRIQLFQNDKMYYETRVEDDGYYYLGKISLGKYKIKLFNKKTQRIVKESEISLIDPREPSIEMDIKI